VNLLDKTPGCQNNNIFDPDRREQIESEGRTNQKAAQANRKKELTSRKKLIWEKRKRQNCSHLASTIIRGSLTRELGGAFRRLGLVAKRGGVRVLEGKEKKNSKRPGKKRTINKLTISKAKKESTTSEIGRRAGSERPCMA